MSETNCEYCGWPLGFCAAGDYCTNPLCSYVDGHYSGPKKPRPEPERTYTQSELDQKIAEAVLAESIEWHKQTLEMDCEDTVDCDCWMCERVKTNRAKAEGAGKGETK